MKPKSILDIHNLYRTSDIRYLSSARERARARAKDSARARDRDRAGISDVGYRFLMSDSYIAILDVGYIYWTSNYTLDVRYILRKQWWHFVLNGT